MSQVLDSVLDDQRRADCARNAKIMQDDMRDLIKIVKARAAANERPVVKPPRLVGAIPAFVETHKCCLCGDPSPTFTCSHCNSYMGETL